FILSLNVPTTQNSTFSLHDALPISSPATSAGAPVTSASWMPSKRRRPYELHDSQDPRRGPPAPGRRHGASGPAGRRHRLDGAPRSEEHTSELQSRENLVCRLLLEKK